VDNRKFADAQRVVTAAKAQRCAGVAIHIVKSCYCTHFPFFVGLQVKCCKEHFLKEKYLHYVICLQTLLTPTQRINVTVTVVRMYIISFLVGIFSVLILTLCCIFCVYGNQKFL
jgi:hypothetical protein